MLVLTRKDGEGIAIGDSIMVKVLEIKGNQVRIGIEAPKDLRIYRQELYQKVCQENQTALQWDMTDFSNVAHLFGEQDREKTP